MNMKTTNTLNLVAVAALVGVLAMSSLATQSGAQEASAKTFTPDQLAERTLHSRAVESIIWGMPAVNYELMYQAMVKHKGAYNQIVYWSGLPSWKNQTLTPNP